MTFFYSQTLEVTSRSHWKSHVFTHHPQKGHNRRIARLRFLCFSWWTVISVLFCVPWKCRAIGCFCWINLRPRRFRNKTYGFSLTKPINYSITLNDWMIDLAGFHQHELVLPRKLAARPSKKVVGRLFSIVSFFLKRFSFFRGNSGWWFQKLFIFIPIWGNDPIWLFFFQMGWNHQLEFISFIFRGDPLLWL